MHCRVVQLLLMAALAGLLASPSAAAPKTFYAIAHMTNSITTIDWAVGQGANGIEADLRFDPNTQQPTVFQHSIGTQACDCTCYAASPLPIPSSNVCSHMDSPVHGGGLVGCKTSVSAASLLAHAAKKDLALVVIDSKVDDGNFPQDSAKLEAAGKAVVLSLVDNLFAKGYKGDVVIGAPYLAQYKYIESAAKAAQNNQYKDRFYFTIDGEGDNASGVLDKLVTLPSNNRVYGTGISACSPASYHGAILTGVSNKNAGVVGLVYIWTLDRDSSIDGYILNGATGVMTNYPSSAVEAAARHGLALAQPGVPNQIPAATSNKVVKAPTLACDCDYSPGGCKISSQAPAGWACDCSYKGAWTCGGSVVACRDDSNPKCKAPDRSLESCLQGGGDCDGYKDYTCDCDYSSGGCKISKAAPANTACDCSYKGAWTCGGTIVACGDESSPKCKAPDKSLAACLQGQGDCGGYSGSDDCDCDYHSGGCTISKAAPAYSACKCTYKGAWTCGGSVVRCSNESSEKCKQPDKSKQACQLAAGSDCGGY